MEVTTFPHPALSLSPSQSTSSTLHIFSAAFEHQARWLKTKKEFITGAQKQRSIASSDISINPNVSSFSVVLVFLLRVGFLHSAVLELYGGVVSSFPLLPVYRGRFSCPRLVTQAGVSNLCCVQSCKAFIHLEMYCLMF